MKKNGTLNDLLIYPEDVAAYVKQKGKKVPKVYVLGGSHLKRFVSTKRLPNPVKPVCRALYLVGKRVFRKGDVKK